jgi:uncharacterized phage protein gp47/JayE
MFEDQTYEAILERMLDRIPDDIDKREGSIIGDALAPAALEIAQVYHLMGIMYRLIFGITTDGDLLTLRASDFGVFRKLATSAIRKGVFTDSNAQLMDIPLDSRFSIDSVVFVVFEKITTGNYLLRSESAGELGNKPFGVMLPIESIDNLGVAEMTELIVPGEEEQSDESLLKTLEENVSDNATSGNKSEYKQWAEEVNGVQRAYVYESWNGPNTVKVVLMNSEGRSPSPLVIQQTWDHIESVRPVGAILTVVGVTERIIAISAKLTLQSDADLEVAKSSINYTITEYFKEIAGVENTIRYTAIGNSILDGVGVLDYTDLSIDGTTANISLSSDEVPVLGTLTLTI